MYFFITTQRLFQVDSMDLDLDLMSVRGNYDKIKVATVAVKSKLFKYQNLIYKYESTYECFPGLLIKIYFLNKYTYWDHADYIIDLAAFQAYMWPLQTWGQ